MPITECGQTAKTVTRQQGCAGWSKSFLCTFDASYTMCSISQGEEDNNNDGGTMVRNDEGTMKGDATDG